METTEQDQSSIEGRLNQRTTYPREGGFTRRVERQTGKTPSMLFLAGSAASIVGSIVLYASGRRLAGIFVGHWAPMFMLLGVYNKLVKEEYELTRIRPDTLSSPH